MLIYFAKMAPKNESEDVFLEVIFFQIFFGHVCGNLDKNSSHPKNLRAPTPMG